VRESRVIEVDEPVSHVWDFKTKRADTVASEVTQ
jgi:hypothetical protein